MISSKPDVIDENNILERVLKLRQEINFLVWIRSVLHTTYQFCKSLKNSVKNLERRNTGRAKVRQLKEPLANGLVFPEIQANELEIFFNQCDWKIVEAPLKTVELSDLYDPSLGSFVEEIQNHVAEFRKQQTEIRRVLIQIRGYFKVLQNRERANFLSTEEGNELQNLRKHQQKLNGISQQLVRCVNQINFVEEESVDDESSQEDCSSTSVSEIPEEEDVQITEEMDLSSTSCLDDNASVEKVLSDISELELKKRLETKIIKENSQKSAKQLDYIKGEIFLEENLPKTIQSIGTGERGMVFAVKVKPFGMCAVKKFSIRTTGRFGFEIGGSGVSFRIGSFKSSIFVSGTSLDDERFNMDDKRELEILNEILCHPNIIRFYGVLQNRSRINIGYVMEYMKGGSLENMIADNPDYLTESQVVRYSLDVAKALAFCHTKYNIAHGNIKPSKVLLTEDRKTAKLGGFGSSRSHAPYQMFRIPNIKYRAPEIINDVGVVYEKYGFKADIWSYAMLIYAITFKREPFTDYSIVSSQKHRDNLLANKRPPTSDWPMREEGFKDEIMEIMKNGWETEPDNRRDIKDIIEILGKVMARVEPFI